MAFLNGGEVIPLAYGKSGGIGEHFGSILPKWNVDGHLEQIFALRRLHRRLRVLIEYLKVHCPGLCLQRRNVSAECRTSAGRHRLLRKEPQR